MSVIEHTSVVTMDFQLFAQDGRLVQNIKDHIFMQGIDDVFPAMAPFLNGKQVNDEVVGELSPQDAFGEVQDFEPVTYRKEDFGDKFYHLYIGMAFPFTNDEGASAVFYVQNLTHDSATFSINHPLAGQCIGFRATVTAIRGATVEEINQGYPTLPIHGTSCSCC